MKRILLFAIIVVVLTGCKSSFYASETKSTYYKMDETVTASKKDTILEQLIIPYTNKLKDEMGGTIGYCFQDLEKGYAENSVLGNWMSDVMMVEGQKISKNKIDFSIINHGSMRIPVLKEGPITKGTIFELMPFDNIVWVLELKGEVVKQLFDHMVARRGWGISKGTSYQKENNLAVDIMINDVAFDINKTYYVCLADYLAKGGDNSSFLKGQPKEELGILLRNALLNFVNDKHLANKKVGVEVFTRVK